MHDILHLFKATIFILPNLTFLHSMELVLFSPDAKNLFETVLMQKLVGWVDYRHQWDEHSTWQGFGNDPLYL
jgi:hypothetical protein